MMEIHTEVTETRPAKRLDSWVISLTGCRMLMAVVSRRGITMARPSRIRTGLAYFVGLIFVGYTVVADVRRVLTAIGTQHFVMQWPLIVVMALAAATVAIALIAIYRWPESRCLRLTLFIGMAAWLLGLFAMFVITHPTRRTRLAISTDSVDAPWALITVSYLALVQSALFAILMIFGWRQVTRTDRK